MPKALLIDDEPPALATLRTHLRAHPEVELVGEATSLDDARALLTHATYDLVFLDVQLRGGTGFDLVPHGTPAPASFSSPPTTATPCAPSRSTPSTTS